MKTEGIKTGHCHAQPGKSGAFSTGDPLSKAYKQMTNDKCHNVFGKIDASPYLQARVVHYFQLYCLHILLPSNHGHQLD